MGTNLVNITRHPEEDAYPAWSPDGSRIAFHSLRDGNLEVYTVDPDGSNPVNLTNDPAADSRPAWSPDGASIAFSSRRNGGDIDIFTMNADGSAPVDITRNEAYADYWPAWSPDGTRIAFASNRDGDFDIYVMDADGSNPVNLTRTNTDAIYPAWITAEAASAIRAASWGAIKAQIDPSVTSGGGTGLEMTLCRRGPRAQGVESWLRAARCRGGRTGACMALRDTPKRVGLEPQPPCNSGKQVE